MRISSLLSQAAVVVTLVLAAAACGGVDPRAAQVAALTGDAKNGAALYGEHCKDCHGDKGQGGFPGPAINTADIKSDDAATMANQVLDGGFLMPGFKDKLDNQDVADLVAFVKAL